MELIQQTLIYSGYVHKVAYLPRGLEIGILFSKILTNRTILNQLTPCKPIWKMSVTVPLTNFEVLIRSGIIWRLDGSE